MKKLLFLFSCLVTVSLLAQDDSSPGRSFVSGAAVATQINTNAIQSSFQPLFTPVVQGSGAIAEQITPDIQTLAANLGNDPTRIFNYVHDQIKYVHYFGSLKGAELTLLERSGNDFDQCALLSALLQAAGYLPGYQFGYMKMPLDAPDHQDLRHWLGLSVQNTNWSTAISLLNTFANWLRLGQGSANAANANNGWDVATGITEDVGRAAGITAFVGTTATGLIGDTGPTYSAIGSTGKVGEQWLAENLGGESQVYFNTSQGGRYVDQLANDIANESKVGYQSLTPTIQQQISKDAELLNSGAVQGVNWHFFPSPVTGVGGPSQQLLNELQQNGINVIIH